MRYVALLLFQRVVAVARFVHLLAMSIVLHVYCNCNKTLSWFFYQVFFPKSYRQTKLQLGSLVLGFVYYILNDLQHLAMYLLDRHPCSQEVEWGFL